MKNGSRDTLHIATVPRDPNQVQALIDQEMAILRVRRRLTAHQPNDFAIFTATRACRPSARSPAASPR